MKTEKIFKEGWLVCWSIKLETWVSSLTGEDTSKTESRCYRFCRRGYLFNREEKSDSGFYETWKNGLCMVYDSGRFRGRWFERVRQICNKVIWFRCGGFLSVKS